MAKTIEFRIYRDAALCIALFLFALIVPRFVPHEEGGFASATSAVLVSAVMLFALGVFSILLFARTLGAFRTLSVPARFAGIGPSVVLVIGVATLLMFLSDH